MTFREIFEKYQAGTANEEERRMVDEELEKAALINEHLFGSWEELPAEPPAGELKQVKKSLRKRNIALVLTSVAVVIALLLSVPLVERVYFDPTQHTTGSMMTDLDVALYCYYDLLAPTQDFLHIDSYTDTGFGTWALDLAYWDGDSPNLHSYLTATVDKNEIQFPRKTLFYATRELFDFAPLEVSVDGMGYDSIWQLQMELNDVEDDDSVYAAVSFNGDLDAEALFELMDRYGFVISWAAVRMGAPAEPLEPLIGMRLDGHRVDPGINAEYPELMEYVHGGNAEQHFRSMVEYCRDYAQNTKDLGIIEDPGYYDTVLEELEEKGLRFYGAYINSTAKTFRALANDGHITDFRLLEIREPAGYAYIAPSFGG